MCVVTLFTCSVYSSYSRYAQYLCSSLLSLCIAMYVYYNFSFHCTYIIIQLCNLCKHCMNTNELAVCLIICKCDVTDPYLLEPVDLKGNSSVVTRKFSDAYYGNFMTTYIYIRNGNNSLIMSRAIDGLAICIIIFYQLCRHSTFIAATLKINFDYCHHGY